MNAQILNYFISQPQVFVEIDESSNDEFIDVYAEKRAEAIAWLGDRWVLSPRYVADNHPQHNVRITA